MDTLRYPVPAVGASGRSVRARRRRFRPAGRLPAPGAARCICSPRELPEAECAGCTAMTATGTCAVNPEPAGLQASGGGRICPTSEMAGASLHGWPWGRDRVSAVTQPATKAADTARSAA